MFRVFCVCLLSVIFGLSSALGDSPSKDKHCWDLKDMSDGIYKVNRCTGEISVYALNTRENIDYKYEPDWDHNLGTEIWLIHNIAWELYRKKAGK